MIFEKVVLFNGILMVEGFFVLEYYRLHVEIEQVLWPNPIFPLPMTFPIKSLQIVYSLTTAQDSVIKNNHAKTNKLLVKILVKSNFDQSMLS